MDKVRVLAIAPYDELRDELERLASRRTDVILTSYVGAMEWGANIVRSIDEEKFDVILSRGGTAESIERITNLPVVDIGLSVYDILAAMTATAAIGRKFAVVGFRGISGTAEVLCDILKYDVEVHTIRYSSDAEYVLSELREKGIDLILGDTVSTETAHRMGMDAVLITSGSLSIEEALCKAVSYFRGYSQLKQANSIYNAALTAQRRQVIVLAQDGQVTFSAPNHIVPAWLHKALRNLAPIVMNDGELRTVRSINRTDYYISANRIDIDGEPYAFFRLNTEGRKMLISIKGVRFYDSAERDVHLARLFYDGTYTSLCEQARRLACSSLSVLVLGENGTSVEEMAGYISVQGNVSGRDIYVVDCEKIDAKGWAKLLGESGLLLFRMGITILFRQPINMSEATFDRLLEFVSESRMQKTNRLIFYVSGQVDSQRVERLKKVISEKLYGCVMELPRLKDRRQDLPRIAENCIDSIRTDTGLNELRLELGAVDTLRMYDWPGNVMQLFRMLTALAAECRGSSISAAMVEAVIKQEMRNGSAELSGNAEIDLSGTLEDIETRIVHYVMSQEDMNRRRTAERLGISRATVWRILRKPEVDAASGSPADSAP